MCGPAVGGGSTGFADGLLIGKLDDPQNRFNRSPSTRVPG
jgi:hypothetical protein